MSARKLLASSSPVPSIPQNISGVRNMAKRGKPTSRQLNPFIDEWMRDRGYTSIYEAATKTSVPQSTLQRWSDLSSDLAIFESILTNSARMGITPTELVQGLLAGKKRHISLLGADDNSDNSAVG